MKKFHVFLFFVLALGSSAQAEPTQNAVTDSFLLTAKIQGCELDMKQHCKSVTPGNNREILCLSAYEDQLQNECRTGLMDAAITLKLGVATLDYAYNACGQDRVSLCGEVQPGERRLINCMKSNAEKISSGCMRALNKTGLWKAATESSPRG